MAAPWLAERPTLLFLDDERTVAHHNIIDTLTLCLDPWIEQEGGSVVSEQLEAIVTIMAAHQKLNANSPGWFEIVSASMEHPDMIRIMEAGARNDPTFANGILMLMAMDPDTTPEMVERMVRSGADPLESVPIEYEDGDSVPEKILDVARRHENPSVRKAFLRQVERHPEEDKVVVLLSPRALHGRRGP